MVSERCPIGYTEVPLLTLVGLWISPAWRLSRPRGLLPALAVAAGVAAFCGPVGVVGGAAVLLWIGAGLTAELAARARARRRGYRARFWVPVPAAWWRRALRQRFGYTLPPCRAVWELHADDAGRWRAATPADAARAFRAAYTAETLRLLADRPPGVALVSSTFNRLRPAEVAAITAAGGRCFPGPVDPRLPRRVPPRAYARLQRRLFGGVVSARRRDTPAAWTTWVVPPRS
jgi:hypothetical protein